MAAKIRREQLHDGRWLSWVTFDRLGQPGTNAWHRDFRIDDHEIPTDEGEDLAAEKGWIA